MSQQEDPQYIYEARDIKEVMINVVLLYILGRSMYNLFINGRLNTESDAKNMIKSPVVTLFTMIVTYLLKWFGLKPPKAIELLINFAADIFIIFVVMLFFIFTFHLLNYNHIQSLKDRFPSYPVSEYSTIAFVFIFKATIMFLIYELIHGSCQLLDQRN